MGREPISVKGIREAEDPDLRASVAAMRRAATEARKIAIQIGTDLIVMRAEQLIRTPANVLREAAPFGSE